MPDPGTTSAQQRVASSGGSSVRPAVVQARRVKRVQAILDAAEEILAQQGYEAASLKAIGERAGIPTASVYHYFPDRYEVEMTLMRRYLQQCEERIVVSVAQGDLVEGGQYVDVVIDVFRDFFRELPAFVALWLGTRNNPMMAALERDSDRGLADRAHRYALERGLIRSETPALVFRLVFEAADRLLEVAFTESAKGDDAIIDEIRRMTKAYLQTYDLK